jgi:hypothetical protein
MVEDEDQLAKRNEVNFEMIGFVRMLTEKN